MSESKMIGSCGVLVTELDDGRPGCWQFPDGLLRVEASLRADDLLQALNHALGLCLLSTDDEAPLMPGEREACDEIRLAAASRTAISGDVSQALVGHRLRPRQRTPRVQGFEGASQLQCALELG